VAEPNAPVHGFALLVLRLALIAGATAASWLLIERPYQRAPRGYALRWAPVGICMAAFALLLLPTTQVTAYASYDVRHIPAPEVGAPVPTVARSATSTSVVTSVLAAVASSIGTTTVPASTAPTARPAAIDTTAEPAAPPPPDPAPGPA